MHRFEEYWVAGQSAVDELMAGLAGALAQVADAYQRRDAQDAHRFDHAGGGFVAF
ncbi:hypothetical protein [Leifsonia xyli]|uniref:hypothetical protein n=1 Tax=Leifsonia xyli TaxID=1575 RepID=UPI003D674EC0